MIIARLTAFLFFVAGLYLIMKYAKKALQNADLTGKLEEQDNLNARLALAKQLSPEEVKRKRDEIKKQMEDI